MGERIEKSEGAWRAELTTDQHAIARCGATEAAFTGAFWDHKEDGVYLCICCGQRLFDSTTKYDSGSGWPSFWTAVADGAIRTKADHSANMQRVELLCARCDAHLGHVFPDGPQPTGLRYCVNSASLGFALRDS